MATPPTAIGGTRVPTPRPPAPRRSEQHPATLTQLALERVKAVSGKPTDPLSVSKVLAGGLASATSAVLASHFGAFGTVGAAAAGSIATALAGWFYQRSIERAQDQVRSKVGAVGGPPRRADTRPAARARAAIGSRKPPARSGAAGSSGGQRRANRLPQKLAIATALIFLFSLAVVSGIEWAKGSALSGGGATTVQEVLRPSAVSTHGSSERRGHANERMDVSADDRATDGRTNSSGADDRTYLDREERDDDLDRGDPDGLGGSADRGGQDGNHQPAPGEEESSTSASQGAGAAPGPNQTAPAPNQTAPAPNQTAPAPNQTAPAPVGPAARWPGPLGGLLTPPPSTPPPAPAGG